jgi:hypothetical protein
VEAVLKRARAAASTELAFDLDLDLGRDLEVSSVLLEKSAP